MTRHLGFILLALLVVLTLAIYLPVLQHDFTNWDDNDYVTENPTIRNLSGENLKHIFTEPIALNYHPLTILSLAINYAVSGSDPGSYFLVNILLHLFNTVLTFFFVVLLPGRNKVQALFVAAVFALHPMHVESVAWISERKDVLYAFFFLSGLISWNFYIGRRNWYYFAGSLILFLLAGLSKPSSVVFPLILLLLDYLFHRKFTLRLFLEKIPFLAVSVFIGIATLNAQVGKSVVDIAHHNFIQQILFASYGFFIYIYKLFIPAGLSAFHPVPLFNTSPDLPPIYFITPLLNLVIIGLAVFSLKYTRYVFFGLIFYLLNIILTLQFLQVGSAVVAERYTYLSYTGLMIGVAWILVRMAEKKRIKDLWVFAIMFLFVIYLAFYTVRRIPVWKDSITLWTDVIAGYPGSYTAYNNRGYAYVKANMPDLALPDFDKAIALMPAFVDALNNRGSLHRLQNEPRKAIGDYTKALTINFEHVKALTGRANAYETLGLLDSALIDMNKAYELNLAEAITLADRGAVYFKLGQFEKAIADCSLKIASDPSNTKTYLNRAVAFSSLGKWGEAIEDYTVVIDSGEGSPAVYEWRGVAYRSIGSYQLAVDDFSKGISMDSAKASLYSNRALTYKQMGLLQLASDDQSIALKLVGGNTD